ncbi:MAG: type I glyceraldehyde-3-phosphate dehydrogenase [Bacillota bacterium]|jgi:glyceraldehyde 3-phosphate dehydrogenase
MLRVGVNGFGSIGRRFLRVAMGRKDLDVVAVNNSADPGTLIHLLKYDTNYGTLSEELKAWKDGFSIGGREVKVVNHRDPAEIPWKDLGVDLVVECTGKFTEARKAHAHIDPAGARKVVISAPGKGEDVTLVMGINHETYDPSKHNIISCSSCTTNALLPVVKVLEESFGIEEGLMTTVHAYTNDQVILDRAHKDLRRARAGALNIIPTTSGAAKSVGIVMPQLKGKFNAMAFRVPTPTVSVVDLVVRLKKKATAEEVNKAMEDAANGSLKGLLGISYVPLVSSDYKGMRESAVVDGLSTMTVGDLVKVVAWYDNEWGYSERLVDLVSFIGSKGI